MILGKKKVFDFYSKKYDCIKTKDHKNVKMLKDFKQLKKEMEDFKTEPFFIK